MYNVMYMNCADIILVTCKLYVVTRMILELIPLKFSMQSLRA